jgi:hypothetical protein
VSTKKVEQLKKRFVEEGFEAALYRKSVTNAHRRKITGDEEAHLIALCCSQAPEGRERWTLRLLADKMVELDVITSVSHGARSQGSNLWQTQVMALGVSRSSSIFLWTWSPLSAIKRPSV